MALEGQPWHEPWKRMCTIPSSSFTSTSSTWPPSSWTYGRIRSSTSSTRLYRSEIGENAGLLSAMPPSARLRVERTPAAARALDVRVLDLEPGTHEPFGE